MGNIREGVDELKALGNQHTKYVFDYNPDVLEKIPNKHDDRDYFVKFNCPEFTSLCPKTGQPDFATIYISYIPDKYIVESKSLKLYLFGFRSHGDFHEDCVNIIMTDLIKLLHPRFIEVWGKFLPRRASPHGGSTSTSATAWRRCSPTACCRSSTRTTPSRSPN